MQQQHHSVAHQQSLVLETTLQLQLCLVWHVCCVSRCRVPAALNRPPAADSTGNHTAAGCPHLPPLKVWCRVPRRPCSAQSPTSRWLCWAPAAPSVAPCPQTRRLAHPKQPSWLLQLQRQQEKTITRHQSGCKVSLAFSTHGTPRQVANQQVLGTITPHNQASQQVALKRNVQAVKHIPATTAMPHLSARMLPAGLPSQVLRPRHGVSACTS